MIQNYGKDKFLQYMTGLLKDKENEKVFSKIFGIEFDKYLVDFNRVQ